MILRRSLSALFVLVLAACSEASEEAGPATDPQTGTAAPAQAPGDAPGNAGDTAPYSGLAPGETIRFTGTEPFWAGDVSGETLTYSTPENIDGAIIQVVRFAGRNGLALSGELEGSPFDMAITPGECSDGMSDRTYPFTVTLEVGGEQRRGCAWTGRKPFSGSENP